MSRMIYAFSIGDTRRLEMYKKYCVGEKGGRFNVLLSILYLKPELLTDWYEAVRPKKLFIDSGVHSFHEKFNLSTAIYDSKNTFEISPAVQKEVDDLAEKYIKVLKQGKFSYIFELDVDLFMGIKQADKYYSQLCDNFPAKKIIRVWHTTRTFEHWKEWCREPNMEYLAIEGGARHNRNVEFYRPFVQEAKKFGKKVHVLAVTTANFFRLVDVDTGDSSSFRSGGRYGSVKVPEIGEVGFGKKKTGKNHYLSLENRERLFVDSWLERINFTAQELLDDENGEIRNMANLFYYDAFIDVKYERGAQNRRLF